MRRKPQTKGLIALRQRTGKEPTFPCENCNCKRYSPCTCKRRKK